MGTSFTGSRNAIGNTLGRFGITRAGFEIGRLRNKFLDAAPGSVVDYDGYRIRITDGKSFYVQIKDEFIHQIYRFEAATKARVANDVGAIEVQIVPLSTSITGTVDFLKLNIEGEELPVLQELESNGSLCLVQQLVLEYHGWPTGDQKLGAILELLDRNDFRYLIHDFDAETGSETKPPFNWHPGKTWFCLIYAANQAKR